MRKTAVVLIVIALISAAGYLLMSRFRDPGKQLSYVLGEIRRGDLEFTISSTGTLSAVGTVVVGAQVNGTIDRLLADHNDTVKKGQLLAVLEKSMFVLAIEEAEAGVSRAKALHDQATRDIARNETLYKKGLISEMDYSTSRTTADTTRTTWQSMVAVLKKAQMNLRYSEIRSPIDGTVIERNIEAGQTVVSNFASPTLFTIAEDLTRMQIDADVDESDIGFIREGQAVRFSVQTYPDEQFSGTVRQIRLKPSVIQNVVNYKVIVDAPNRSGRLLPGMTATVLFVIETAKNVLQVPNAALRFKPESPQAAGGTLQGEKLCLATSGETPGTPCTTGLIWVLDQRGAPVPVEVITGITDGKMTGIRGSSQLKEGIQAVTGVSENVGAKTSGFKLPPPPPGGKPPF
ncbi:MAG: efflux RND transporter periplasmic adaptor subunit [Myxococcota bacterium]|jgi:HlyD family secretion protein